jgi:membrane-associated PAP2 superfamily phosphatase
MHLLFYSGIKTLLIAVSLFFFTGVLIFRHSSWVTNNRAAILTLLLSVIFVPAFIGSIKALSNMPCPKNILFFNGDTAYYKLFQEPSSQSKHFKCFPAGHAGAGFSLLALVFFGKNGKQRCAIGTAVLALAWLMGAYKMAIGHHFLSHTIASMLFAWLMILQFAYLSFYTLAQHSLRRSLQTQQNSVTSANR